MTLKKTAFATLFAACVLLCVLLAVRAEAREAASELIRLHVIASAETPEATAHKEAVRDAILETFFTDAVGTIEEERAFIRVNLDSIKELAQATLRKRGAESKVTVEFGQKELPGKTYGGFALPAGTYETLTVTIGEGRGSNWWCVLFPPLCIVPAEAAASAAEECGMSAAGFRTVAGDGTEIRVRFKLLEMLSAIEKKLTKKK